MGYAEERYKQASLKYIYYEVVCLNGCPLEYASNELKDNEEVVLEAIKEEKSALQYASNRLQQKFCISI